MRPGWLKLYVRPATKRSAPYLVFGISARSRWRWLRLEAGYIRDTAVLSVVMQTWLTDASERGNLRRKAFVRFRAALGGPLEPGERGCEVRSPKGTPCTWERGHMPMVIGFRNMRTGGMVSGAKSVRVHSWAVRTRLPDNAVIIAEPRRPSKQQDADEVVASMTVELPEFRRIRPDPSYRLGQA